MRGDLDQGVLEHLILDAGLTELIAQFGNFGHGEAAVIYEHYALGVFQLFADTRHYEFFLFLSLTQTYAPPCH